MLNNKIIIQGINRQQYSFSLFEKGTKFFDMPGIYIFLRKNIINTYDPIYIGETSNFQNRIDVDFIYHNQFLCITKQQYTHIAVLETSEDTQERIDIETNIRKFYTTPCNKQ